MTNSSMIGKVRERDEISCSLRMVYVGSRNSSVRVFVITDRFESVSKVNSALIFHSYTCCHLLYCFTNF